MCRTSFWAILTTKFTLWSCRPPILLLSRSWTNKGTFFSHAAVIDLWFCAAGSSSWFLLLLLLENQNLGAYLRNLKTCHCLCALNIPEQSAPALFLHTTWLIHAAYACQCCCCCVASAAYYSTFLCNRGLSRGPHAKKREILAKLLLICSQCIDSSNI